MTILIYLSFYKNVIDLNIYSFIVTYLMKEYQHYLIERAEKRYKAEMSGANEDSEGYANKSIRSLEIHEINGEVRNKV